MGALETVLCNERSLRAAMKTQSHQNFKKLINYKGGGQEWARLLSYPQHPAQGLAHEQQ